MSLTVDQQDLRRISRAMERTIKLVGDKQTRLDVAKAGAKPVIDAARQLAPVYTKAPFHFGGRNASGAKILSGNLRLSIQDLTGRLKRAGRIIIGPLVKRKGGAKVYGRNERNANAYYAQMIYGSARAFGERVTQRAMLAVSSTALNRMKKEADKKIDVIAKRAGLQ